ncbi:MAG: MMPL family transporter [Enterobacterales bacterium]|nr:MMPL family transporter [Enterobacterales bacterium]
MNVIKNQTHQIIRLIINYPKSFLIATILLTTLLAIGIKNLSISNDFRVYLSQDNPQLMAFEAFEDHYTKSDSATFVISPQKGQDLFSQRGLSLISQLTERAWLVESAYRVSSLSNYIYSKAQDDVILSDFLYSDPQQLTPAQIKVIRQTALSETRLVQSLMTADGKLTVIVINLRLNSSHPNASIEVTEEMEAIRNEFRQAYPEFQIENGGSTAFNTTLARAVAHDLTYLMPLSYLIIFSGLWFFLRSFWATASIFILITSCLVSTFGFFGWVWPVLTPIAGFAPSILLSIMVADSVHILVSYFHEIEKGTARKKGH